MTIKSAAMSLLAVVVILSPLWGSHLLWKLTPETELNMLVVDYTVPVDTYDHHKGLFWLLNYFRIRGKGNSDIWRDSRDYLGYKPDKLDENKHLSEVSLDNYDWVYVADTYGVYGTNRAGQDDEILDSYRVPKLLFGAFSLEDAAALFRFAEGGGNVVFEFNSFVGPTKKDARTVAESVAGVKWTGWAGRFVSDLADETSIPSWFKSLFEAQYEGRPLPSGPGILLVHETGRLVVLDGAEFEKSVPFLRVTSKGKERFSSAHGTPPIFGWFSIVSKMRDTEVLAEVFLPTPLDWKVRCRDARIPIIFPLLTRSQKDVSTRYYISSNIANLEKTPNFYQLAGLALLQAAIHRRRDNARDKPAYWQFYLTAMGEILKEASRKRSEVTR
ncbi:MAG: hypothetical protein GY854_32690 [Deltaproteobacteria bacterium]|nr:hypothetical protein [Deltaproteobacteria bacterium]